MVAADSQRLRILQRLLKAGCQFVHAHANQLPGPNQTVMEMLMGTTARELNHKSAVCTGVLSI
jgi:ubiquinone/menaquinone biosynthesis C-methylase UbiE